MTDTQHSAPVAPARPGAGSQVFRAILALFGLRPKLAGRAGSGHAAVQTLSITGTGTHTVLLGRTGYGKGHAPAQPGAPVTIIDGCVRDRPVP